jgi:hypothetical protein
MKYEALAAKLADRSRSGMSDALAGKLGIKTAEAFRGELLAMTDGPHGALGVYLLAVYVIDDTDVWSDGEIYWWSIPALVTKAGTATWGAGQGLPNGAPPQKCGDLEWLTTVALKEPPLLAVIPPDDQVASCVVRVAVYDDDGAPAKFPEAMTAGFEALAQCKREGQKGADNIVVPVREAIFKGLRGEQDDILVEEDLTLRREDARFGVGLIGSLATTKARVYYVVKDELRTVTAGPLALRAGQDETIRFEGPLEAGGRLAIFARAAKRKATVTCAIGELTTDTPFAGKVLDQATAKQLAAGIRVSATADASVVAYYTPPG